MTIWSGPSLTKPGPGSGGLKKCLKGLKMTKNKQNMSRNKNYWWVTFKNFLRIGSRDINNDNLIRPPAYNSLGLGQGGSKRARRSSKWPKTSKIYPKTRIIGGLQKCPNYKMCRSQIDSTPPYSPNALAKLAQIFGGSPFRHSFQDHRGEFWISS